MVNKKIPLRKCVVTKEQHPKNEMFRIVRTPENNIIIDDTASGKQKGHGAYLTKDLKVIDLAQKKHILDTALEIKVPDEIYDKLRELLK